MFNYDSAFSRNIGWITEAEQQQIKQTKVAIAGCGGVGFEHAVTLARLGIEHFHISDFDEFDVHNTNRQAGAFVSTYGKPKSQVLEQVLLDINPNIQVKQYPQGVLPENVESFFDSVDVYIDSLDFFALDARLMVFKTCNEKSIPVVTAAPLGMGVAFLCFMPGKMSYEEYFRFEDKETKADKLIQFLIGLSPAMLQRDYLVDPSKADFKAEKGPSTAMAVKMCSGVLVTNVVKIVLKRGDVLAAPYGLHFDAYKNTMKKTCLRLGNRGPIQRTKFAIAKRIVMAD